MESDQISVMKQLNEDNNAPLKQAIHTRTTQHAQTRTGRHDAAVACENQRAAEEEDVPRQHKRPFPFLARGSDIHPPMIRQTRER